MKKSPVSDRMAKVENRLGKTTGASKGSKPAPPAKLKAQPVKGGFKAKWEKKF